MVKFGYTILYVAKVTSSIEFYENGFGLNRKFITPSNSYAELETGQTSIAFTSLDMANQNLKNGFLQSDLINKPFAIELAFVTNDVEAIVNRAKQIRKTITKFDISTNDLQIVTT